MNLTDQLGYEMMALLFDGSAPLSVVFPEARVFLPQTQEIDVHSAIEWIRAAADKGWITLSVDEMDGNPWRPATLDDLVRIADEYKRGLRNPNEIRQIFDRFDLWLEISAQGREAVTFAWPDMPPEA